MDTSNNFGKKICTLDLKRKSFLNHNEKIDLYEKKLALDLINSFESVLSLYRQETSITRFRTCQNTVW